MNSVPFSVKIQTTYKKCRLGPPIVPSQQARHGQMTSKQRYINIDSVGTTLFRRRLTMICPLGSNIVQTVVFNKRNKLQEKI